MPQLVLTHQDDGGSFQIDQGGTVAVRLEETASTGYRWAVASDTAPTLTFQGDQIASSSASIGSKDTIDFAFHATQIGTAKIQLKLWREWEGDKSVIERFAATIHVR